MSRSNNSTPFTTIGVSSLLVVFLILCLVTFACLSLSTARSDYEFSKDNAKHKTEYYNASNTAEEHLNDLSTGRTNDTKWTIKINDKHALKVEVDITGSSAAGGKTYEITRWQVVSTVNRDYNQNMNLMGR
ncbi:MAG: hypothetical protein PUB75_00660 [Firmicutes bacterium]|nr:hypothetical protein [Bacillota bacterium]